MKIGKNKRPTTIGSSEGGEVRVDARKRKREEENDDSGAHHHQMLLLLKC